MQSEDACLLCGWKSGCGGMAYCGKDNKKCAWVPYLHTFPVSFHSAADFLKEERNPSRQWETRLLKMNRIWNYFVSSVGLVSTLQEEDTNDNNNRFDKRLLVVFRLGKWFSQWVLFSILLWLCLALSPRTNVFPPQFTSRVRVMLGIIGLRSHAWLERRAASGTAQHSTAEWISVRVYGQVCEKKSILTNNTELDESRCGWATWATSCTAVRVIHHDVLYARSRGWISNKSPEETEVTTDTVPHEQHMYDTLSEASGSKFLVFWPEVELTDCSSQLEHVR